MRQEEFRQMFSVSFPSFTQYGHRQFQYFR